MVVQFDEGKYGRVGVALREGAVVAKVTDFGLSRRLARETHASNVLQARPVALRLTHGCGVHMQ